MHDAMQSLPCPAIRRPRAEAQAVNVFRGRIYGPNGLTELRQNSDEKKCRMADEHSTNTNEQPDGNTDDAVRIEASQGHRLRESTFADQVIDAAHHHGWQSFHLRDRDSIHIVRGIGIP